jgi:hypothetical protein
VTGSMAVDVSLRDLTEGAVRLRRGATGTSGLPSYPCSLCSHPVLRGERFRVMTPHRYAGAPVIAHERHVRGRSR